MTRKADTRARTSGEIFRWPLFMALANAVGLIAALIGDGMLDWLSWLTLGATVIVMVVAWNGWTPE